MRFTSIARRTVTFAVAAACSRVPAIGAQQPGLSAPFVSGRVVAHGLPVAGVNVFDLETLEGMVTGPDGAFTIPVADRARTTVHITARRVGYKPGDATAPVDADSVVIEMESFTSLASVAVLAGRFTATADRSTTLTPLEVMTTPGGNGDVNSAVKTLPGVQNADEGSGLFVRGGDFTETRILLEGAPMFTAYQFEAPTGSVAGTINPFLTDGITFASGGFGAQWGNVLSGIVDLRTQGRPQSTNVSVNATLLSVGGAAAARMPHGLGFSATAGFSDLTQLLALNGNPRDYRPPPRGQTYSAQGTWEYSKTGRVKLFSLMQRNSIGIAVDDPAVRTTYRAARASDIVVLSLRDTVGKWRPFVGLSTSGLGRDDSKGAYDGSADLRSVQSRAELGYVWSERANATVGGEVERITATYDTRFPANGYDPGPDAPTSHTSLDRAGTRRAAYLTLDTRPLGSVELVTGVRADRSEYTASTTVDPRVSIAWVPRDLVTLTASWGLYHQVADPAFLGQSPPGTNLPALRAEMWIVGAQVGEGDQSVRVEGWQKRYRDLVGFTRDFAAVPGLSGRATGIDLFAKSPGPAGTRLRLTWSAAWSRRADPNTGLDARAPFDVTHSVTAVVERDWQSGWHVGVSHRFATGRPYTDVVAARLEPARGVYVPAYGAPYAASLPDYNRADIAVSRAFTVAPRRFLVIFGAINNLLNTANVYSYTWTRDYAARVSVPSAYNRTLFVGANYVLTRKP